MRNKTARAITLFSMFILMGIVFISLYGCMTIALDQKFLAPGGTRMQWWNDDTLTDPSYSEMKTFLAKDTTDIYLYIADTYTCVNFSRDTIFNAGAKGWKCAYVVIDIEEMSQQHAIIMFNTTDKGKIFVEPITDGELQINPETIIRIEW